MGLVMDLVAGSEREILLVVAVGDLATFDDRRRFAAHMSFGGMVDPTWLDLFAEAVRTVTDQGTPTDFIDARTDLGPADAESALTVERVDPDWVDAVARIADADLDGIAGRWIDRLEEELGHISGEEKPWIRELAGQLVQFCRAADRAPDVIFLWALR